MAKNTLILIMILYLTACGGKDKSVEAPYAGLGKVEQNRPLTEAVLDYDLVDRISPQEVSLTNEGLHIVRSKLELVFHRDTSIAEAVQILKKYQAVISSSIAGGRSLVVRIPDPGDIVALSDLMNQLEQEAPIWFVQAAIYPKEYNLPKNYFNDAFEIEVGVTDIVDPLIQQGVFSAWTLRKEIKSRPKVYILDYFGDGPPNQDFDVVIGGGEISTGNSKHHGYHALGIIAGRHGNDKSLRGLVNGVVPATVESYVFDLAGDSGPLDLLNRTLLRLKAIEGTKVLHTGLGDNCSNEGISDCADLEFLKRRSVLWIEKIRNAALEDSVLHVTAAGNIENGADNIAANSGSFSAAALYDDLVDDTGKAVEKLSNTLVVENHLGFDDPCLSPTSRSGGHISALGNKIYSFADATTSTLGLGGTSSAAAIVSGAAAYLAAVKPDISVMQLVSTLKATANSISPNDTISCANNVRAPAINVYQALLAVDSLNQDRRLRVAQLESIYSLMDDVGQANDGANGVIEMADLNHWETMFSFGGGGTDLHQFYIRSFSVGGIYDFDVDTKFEAASYISDLTTRVYREYARSGGNGVNEKRRIWDLFCYYIHDPRIPISDEDRNAMEFAVKDRCLPYLTYFIYKRQWLADYRLGLTTLPRDQTKTTDSYDLFGSTIVEQLQNFLYTDQLSHEFTINGSAAMLLSVQTYKSAINRLAVGRRIMQHSVSTQLQVEARNVGREIPAMEIVNQELLEVETFSNNITYRLELGFQDTNMPFGNMQLVVTDIAQGSVIAASRVCGQVIAEVCDALINPVVATGSLPPGVYRFELTSKGLSESESRLLQTLQSKIQFFVE